MKNERSFTVSESASTSYSDGQGSGYSGSSQCLESELKIRLIGLRQRSMQFNSLHITMRQNRPQPVRDSSSLSDGCSSSIGYSNGISLGTGNDLRSGWSGSHFEDTPKRHAKVYGLPMAPNDRCVWKTKYNKDESGRDIVCYIPEQGDNVYTNQDIYELCHHDHELAGVVLDRCNGERPEDILTLGLDELIPESKEWKIRCVICGRESRSSYPLTYEQVITKRGYKLDSGRIQHICEPCQDLYLHDVI